MKKNRLIILGMAALLLFSSRSYSAVFTAVANGNWSSNSTWALSLAPGFNITSADEIIIPVGMNVTLDQDLQVNHLLASVTVSGSLSGTNDLNLNAGTLTGAGSINLDSLRFGTTANSIFAGTITVNSFENNQVLFGLASSLYIQQDLILRGGLLQLNMGSIVNLSNDATVTLNGGMVALNGGMVNAAGMLNLRYAGNAGSMGPEISLQGITDILVDMDTDEGEITASGDLTVNAALNLQRGRLNLNGFDLVVNGTINSEGGTIFSDAGSNISINGLADVGLLNFAGQGNTVNDLSLTIGNNGSISLMSDLTVQGNLNLNSGSLVINGQNLTLNGSINLNGTGGIRTDIGSGITVNGSGQNFLLGLDADNAVLGDLVLNLDGNGSAALSGNLTLGGMLSLNEGTLILDGYDLIANGQVMVSNSASITSSALSDITLNGTSQNILRFGSNANTVGNLNLNFTGGGEVSLDSDVEIENALNIGGGTLRLNENQLTLNGMLNMTGEGSIASDAMAGLTLNGSGGLLRFSEGSALLGNLDINLEEGSTITAGSDIMTYGAFDLSQGTLDLNGFDLTTNGTINIASTGTLLADAESMIRVMGSGSVGNLSVGGSQNTIGGLTINIADNGNLALNSDLLIDGNLVLDNGRLQLNGRSITVNGIVDASGTGSIMADMMARLNITGTGSAGIIEFSENGNILGDLSLDLTNGGNINLGSDLEIANALRLTNGRINLHDFDLTLDADAVIENASENNFIATTGGGSLIMDVTAGSTATLFPIGTDIAYAPVRIANGATSASGSFMARVAADVFAQGTQGNDISVDNALVDMTWFVESEVESNLDATVETFWNAQAERNSFDRTRAYLSHYSSVDAEWDTVPHAAANVNSNGYFSVSRSGLTSLSPFAVFGAPVTSVEYEYDAGLTIYPNPVANTLFLDPETFIDIQRVRIFDILGNEVEFEVRNDVYSGVDVTFLLPGVYYLTVNDAFIGKFSKE